MPYKLAEISLIVILRFVGVRKSTQINNKLVNGTNN